METNEKLTVLLPVPDVEQIMAAEVTAKQNVKTLHPAYYKLIKGILEQKSEEIEELIVEGDLAKMQAFLKNDSIGLNDAVERLTNSSNGFSETIAAIRTLAVQLNKPEVIDRKFYFQENKFNFLKTSRTEKEAVDFTTALNEYDVAASLVDSATKMKANYEANEKFANGAIIGKPSMELIFTALVEKLGLTDNHTQAVELLRENMGVKVKDASTTASGDKKPVLEKYGIKFPDGREFTGKPFTDAVRRALFELGIKQLTYKKDGKDVVCATDQPVKNWVIGWKVIPNFFLSHLKDAGLSTVGYKFTQVGTGEWVDAKDVNG